MVVHEVHEGNRANSVSLEEVAAIQPSPYLGINIQGVTVFNNVPVHMLQIQTHLYKDRGER